MSEYDQVARLNSKSNTFISTCIHFLPFSMDWKYSGWVEYALVVLKIGTT